MTTELTLLSRVAYRGQEITGPRLRGLLALLAGDLRTGCSSTRLVDEALAGQAARAPAKALQVVVSRARAQLGADVIASTPATASRWARTRSTPPPSWSGRRRARRRPAPATTRRRWPRPRRASRAVGGGAGQRRHRAGRPGGRAARPERTPTYRSLVRARALALSRLGRHAEAAEALADLARERPRDEEVLAGAALRGSHAGTVRGAGQVRGVPSLAA